MDDKQPAAELPIEAPPVEVRRNELQPGERQPHDPRRRLRELLAIPDRERSDALWDELIALEIQLAPGNRAQSPQAENGRRQEQPGRQHDAGRRPEQQARRQEPTPGKRPGKRFFKKPKRGPGGPGFQN